ncbi:MAG: hypothetical protein ACKVQR_19715 [Aquabacterium sp.]
MSLSSRLKHHASHWVRLLPGQGQGLRRMVQQARASWKARQKARAAAASGWRLPDPDRVLELAPSDIVGHTHLQPAAGPPRELRNAVFGHDVLPGAVIGGDWDLDVPPFEALAAYRSIEQRVRTGVSWRETDYFKESMRDIESGRPLWNCRNADELEARLCYIDGVVDSVRQHGLRRQRDVTAAQDPTRRWSDEAEVNIGRDGAILFQDGRHRMAIAKVLGVPVIPVKVRVRHLLWQKLREQLLDLRRPTSAGALLAWPAPHPDLADIACDAAGAAALAALLPRLPAPQVRVLDLEGRLGFVTHHLLARGDTVSTVEPDIVLRGLGERLATRGRTGYAWSSGPPAEVGAHDVVLAVGAGPSAPRGADGDAKLHALLRGLDARVGWAATLSGDAPGPAPGASAWAKLPGGWTLWGRPPVPT